MEVAFEVSGDATALKSITSQAAGLFLPHSIVSLNASTGASIQTTELPKKKNNELIDAVFLEDQRYVIVRWLTRIDRVATYSAFCYATNH